MKLGDKLYDFEELADRVPSFLEATHADAKGVEEYRKQGWETLKKVVRDNRLLTDDSFEKFFKLVLEGSEDAMPTG